MKRVLIIAMDFPPRTTSAVYRAVGFTTYLSQFGWHPTVLTVESSRADVDDAQLLEKIPLSVGIERTPYLRIGGWEDSAATALRSMGALKAPSNIRRTSSLDRLLRSLGDFVRSCVYFPDDTVGWVPFGFNRAAELHLHQRFDAIYTTSPPRSSPLIGLLLKSLFGTPWVAEFRDPWYPRGTLRNPKFQVSEHPVPHPWRGYLEGWLLSSMLHRADAVVVISKGYAQELERAYAVSGSKVTVVSNGFDENDFIRLNGKRTGLLAPGYFHLSHFGTVYPNFCGNFFTALTHLVKERPELRDRVRVNIVGFADDATVKQHAAEGELRGIIQIHRFVSHGEALQAMRASNCLLLFLGHRQVARLSGLGKIYEYLRTGRPILAVAYEGGTKELVEEGRAGWVVNPDDTEGIKQTLETILRDGGMNDAPRPVRPEFVEQFRYDYLAGKLAQVLDKVVSHAR